MPNPWLYRLTVEGLLSRLSYSSPRLPEADYRGIEVKAGRLSGVQQEAPSDPAKERGDAGDREASVRTGPRPHGESGGEHAGYDDRHLRYQYAVHRHSFSGASKSRTGSHCPRYTRTSSARMCTKDSVLSRR